MGYPPSKCHKKTLPGKSLPKKKKNFYFILNEGFHLSQKVPSHRLCLSTAWEMRSNTHKQTLIYTYARNQQDNRAPKSIETIPAPLLFNIPVYSFSLIFLILFKMLKDIIHLSEMRMLTSSSFKRLSLHSFSGGGLNSIKQWSRMGGYFT